MASSAYKSHCRCASINDLPKHSFRWQVSSLQSCSRLCMLQPCRQLPPLLQQMPNHLVLHLQQSHKRSIGIWDALLLCGRHRCM